MSKKVIKEVEVKFTPAFTKAINGETPIKKTKKAAPTKKAAKPKATAKPATKKVTAKTGTITKVKARATAKPKATTAKGRPKAKHPRGYTITPVQRELTLNGEKALYDLFELAGPKMDKTRYFVDEASAQKYIAYNDSDTVATVALSGKGFQHIKGVISAHKDLLDAADLPEMNTELPEKCDATSIEDTDA